MKQNTPLDKIEVLASTITMTLFRVIDPATRQTFLLKEISGTQNRLSVLHREINLCWQLGCRGTLEPLNILDYEGQVGLLFKDLGCGSLRSLLASRQKTKVEEFIKMVYGLVEMLVSFHAHNLLVGELKPEYILIHPGSYQCHLICFDKVCDILSDEEADEQIRYKAKDYHYTNQKQLNGLKKRKDLRGDQYLLGILLFELLSGRSLFDLPTTYDAIYEHLMITPESLSSIDLQIPACLNDIILKLLDKDPERRYPSLQEMQENLKKIEHEQFGKEKGDIAHSSEHEQSQLWRNFTTFIGRQQELYLLDRAMDLVIQGNKQTVFIHGYSGVGKSRMVQEFISKRKKGKGFIITAKFDVLQKGTPYSALISALKDLIHRLLEEEEHVLAYWRERLARFLDYNSNVLYEVVPDLKFVLGEKPLAEKLPPEEAQQRFIQTFVRFIECFTTDEYALTLFLDDMQWADIASLKAVELMLLAEPIKNFLFITCFRDNEVDRTHPFSIFFRKLDQLINIKEVGLLPLSEEDTRQFLYELMRRPVKNFDAFVSQIHNKTSGNTFFIIQLISLLQQEGQIYITERGYWVWDENALSVKPVTDNVIDLLTSRINNLNDSLKTLLITSACLGDVFDFKTMLHLLRIPTGEIFQAISTAVNLGYLLPVGELFDWILNSALSGDDIPSEKQEKIKFRFSHDKIRQAAASLANENELALMNLQVGAYKLDHLSEEEIADQIFYLANNFNYGQRLIRDQYQMAQLIELNYKAAMKAKNASAYHAAIDYLNIGSRYLNIREHRKLLYSFILEKSVCEFLCGQYAEAERDLAQAFELAETRLEKLEVLFPRVYLYTLQDEKKKAIEVAKVGYKLFGKKIPDNKFVILKSLFWDILKTRFWINPTTVNRLINRPSMREAEKVRFMEFTLAIAPAIYQYSQPLFAWNVLNMVSMSLRFGNTGVSSFGYLGFGMILSQMFGQYKLGEKLGALSLLLNNKLEYTALKWKLLLSYYNFVHHWTQPVRPDLERILEIENGAFANGDPVFAGYAIFIYHQKKFALGYDLKLLQQSFEDYLSVAQQRHDSETYYFLLSYYYAIRCLRGLEQDIVFLGKEFNVFEQLSRSIRSASFSITADTYIAYLTILYHFGEVDYAVKHYLEGCKYMEFIQQRYEFSEYNFYGGLICSMAVERGLYNRSEMIKRLKGHLKKFKIWKKYCPVNFEVQFYILAAELAKLEKNGTKASLLYEKAIEMADRYSMIHQKAIASELAAKYQLKNGNKLMASAYFENARNSYQSWGAHAKVRYLENEFRMAEAEKISKRNANADFGTLSLAKEIRDIIQTTNYIKGDMHYDKAVREIMQLVMRYCGADTGCFMVCPSSEPVVKAFAHTVEGIQLTNIYPDNNTLPLPLVKYVLRTRNSLSVDLPESRPEYSEVVYFKNHHPVCILCYPLLRQEHLLGILYLENYTYSGAFTQERIDLLGIISAQLGVILDFVLFNENYQREELLRNKLLEDKELLEKKILEIEAEIQKQTMNHISQELHDNIGQILSLARMTINTMKIGDATALQEKINNAQQLVGRAIQDLRNLSRDLNIRNVEERGLRNAIELELELINHSGAYRGTLIHSGESLELTHHQEIILFRIFQECINNIIKHADASIITVEVSSTPSEFRLLMSDNGKGFDLSSLHHGQFTGAGMRNMKDRAQTIGANLFVHSKLGDGTTIEVILPLSG